MAFTLAARRSMLHATGFAVAVMVMAAPSRAVTTSSWNGYKWARTGTLKLQTVSRLSSSWKPYVAPALKAWSAASQIDLVGSTGSYSSACNPVFATIQVCNGQYGTNGWLGYANVYLSGGRIVQATLRLNDSYFRQDRYDTGAFRAWALCHELGHTIGLAHNNSNRSDKNTGSCMDYTNDPDGGTRYGKSNLAPGKVDFDGLDAIYKIRDKTQLSGTKLTPFGDGLFVDGWNIHTHISVAGVPEPGPWAMLIAGFGLVGRAMRQGRVGVRRRTA